MGVENAALVTQRRSLSIYLYHVHFTFDLPPPTNISTMFGNFLNGIEKKLSLESELGCQLYVGLYEIA